MRKILALLLCLPGLAAASTFSDYNSQLKWVSSSHKELFSGICHISYGTTGVSFEKPVLFVVGCDGFKDSRIYIWTKTNLASISNGDGLAIPARLLKSDIHHVSLFTAEGETITFETCGNQC
ncbi:MULTISPECIES: hypothetical protein [unclassified Burkholderia]|uniref:hypothetical protein n=1 Tax=unclassified Burkholderia TaxID=2613784 RepID=UPI000F5AFB58|nr:MULTISPECIES: hypothetical protein [unclassified Burkholderia]